MCNFLWRWSNRGGSFLESLDFASLHQLPVLFVCEDNNFSVYSNKLKDSQQKEI